jgi:hypothetical protein
MPSSKEFWTVHLVSAFQGFPKKDGDPSGEYSSGIQAGLTIETGGGTFENRASGSLIFHEVIRDDTVGNPGSMGLLERYTVVHESGHQFLLQHADGYAPPPGPAGDFIMTDNTNASGFAPNMSFSPRSLDKIRDIEYPPQP